MKRCLVIVSAVALVLCAAPLFAQQKATIQNVPEISYTSVPNLLKVPSSGIVCRGPASNIQVTLSDRPFGWQTTHAPQASCDIRPCGPRPLKNNSSPRRIMPAVEVGLGRGEAAPVPTIAGAVGLEMSMIEIDRLTKLKT